MGMSSEWMQKADQLQGVSMLKIIMGQIERMFDFYYLAHHQSFASLVQFHPKGYVSYKDIFRQPNFNNLSDLYGIRLEEEYEQITGALQEYIKKNSKKLWSNPMGVRRLAALGSRSDSFRPVFIQNFDAENCEDFQTLIAGVCEVSKFNYASDCSYVMVHTNKPSRLLELNGYDWGKGNLVVLDEQELRRSAASNRTYGFTRYKLIYCEDNEIYPCMYQKYLANGQQRGQAYLQFYEGKFMEGEYELSKGQLYENGKERAGGDEV